MGLPQQTDDEWYAFRLKRNADEGDVATLSRGWTRQQISKPIALIGATHSFYFRLAGGTVTASVNGYEILRKANTPRPIQLDSTEYRLGLGAFNDMNDTVIRYKEVKVRLVNEVHPRETSLNGTTDTSSSRAATGG